MLIYQVTVVLEDMHAERVWAGWMQRTHIPEVMATGLFREAKIYKIKDAKEAMPSYCVQYACASAQKLRKYFSLFANDFRRKHEDKFKGKFRASRLVMEIKKEF